MPYPTLAPGAIPVEREQFNSVVAQHFSEGFPFLNAKIK